MESLQEHIQNCVKCSVLKIEQYNNTTHVHNTEDKDADKCGVFSLFLFPSLDLSAVAAGERGSGGAPGEQHGQPASGQPGPHSGGAR